MLYIYGVKTVKANNNGEHEYDILQTCTPLAIGMVIGWKADHTEQDGIKKWEVKYRFS